MNIRTSLFLLVAVPLLSVCFKNQQTPLVEDVVVDNDTFASVEGISNGSTAENFSFRHQYSGRKFIKVEFVDTRSGWATADTGLFRSEDRGRSWTEIAVPMESSSSIVASSFVDQGTGWLACQLDFTEETQSFEEFTPFLLHTVDGGHSWIRRDLPANSRIIDIKANATSVWVVGEQIVRNPIRNTLALLLASDDRGLTWRDHSESLNNILVQAHGGVTQHVRSLVIREKDVLFLTSDGAIISFYLNEGRVDVQRPSLHPIARQIKYPNDCPLSKIDFVGEKIINATNGRLWLAGNFYDLNFHSAPVFAGLLYETKGGWNRIYLPRVNIRDIELIDSDRIVISGITVDSPSKSSLFYSDDAGNNWHILFDTIHNEIWKSIVEIEGQIIAVSDQGTIISLSLRKLPVKVTSLN